MVQKATDRETWNYIPYGTCIPYGTVFLRQYVRLCIGVCVCLCSVYAWKIHVKTLVFSTNLQLKNR